MNENMFLINPSINPRSQTSLVTSFIYDTFHPGLGFIATYLEKYNSVKIKIIDEQVSLLTEDILCKELKKLSEPKVVGITSLAINSNRAFELARTIKRIERNALVIMGGIHATVLPEDCLKTGAVDIIVRGEGEETMSELYEVIMGSKNLKSVRGISYKGHDTVIHTPDRGPISDLNRIPPFPYHLFDAQKYKDFGTIISSRGCPYNCIFCSQRCISGNRYRYFSAERILEDIKILVDKYHQKKIFFLEDNFAVSKKRLHELTEKIIQSGYNEKVGFITVCRGDSIDLEILKKLKKANFIMLDYGLETSSDRLMKVLDKGETVEQVTRALKMTKEIGIYTNTTFIFGIPTETRQDRYRSIKLSRMLPVDGVRFNILTPYPGTRAYEMAKKENRLRILPGWENFSVQYYWIGDQIPYYPENTNPYELIFDTMFANLQFYFRVAGIVKFLKAPLGGGAVISMPKNWYRSPQQIIRLLKLVFFLVSRFLKISVKMFLYRWGLIK